jgi:peptidoglycan hydrolase-like protein with peptidoglycan-binding domain
MTARPSGGAAVLAAAAASAVLLAGCGTVATWTPASEASTAATPDAGSPAAAAPSPDPSPTWSSTVEPARAARATPTPTETQTPSPSPTASKPAPTRTRTTTPKPSRTPAAAPTRKPKPKPTTRTRTASPTPTATATPSATPTPKASTKLVVGDSGPAVLALQRRLSELGYWLGTPDGAFGALTQQAVFALQKSAGIGRDGVVGPHTTRALEAGTRPRVTLSGDGVEIDLARQVLVVVRDGRARTILNTSTGNGEEYTSTRGNRAIATTPKGRFTVYRAVDGPLTNSLGELWRPRFFNRGIAVHGSPNIPPTPASHGCARLSNAAIDMIWADGLMPVGSRVVVR